LIPISEKIGAVIGGLLFALKRLPFILRVRVFMRSVIPIVAVISCGVCACDTIGEQVVSDPSRYATYPCGNIEAEMATTISRQAELEQLMSRSSQGAGGAVANVLAYRTEYFQNKGRLTGLAKAAADKKCISESEYTSRRSLY
jgi:hypothetical protein